MKNGVAYGPAHPYNIGSTRAVPEHIAKEMERACLDDRLVAHLLREFIKESGMNGPEGFKRNLTLNLRPELSITGGEDAPALKVVRSRSTRKSKEA